MIQAAHATPDVLGFGPFWLPACARQHAIDHAEVSGQEACPAGVILSVGAMCSHPMKPLLSMVAAYTPACQLAGWCQVCACTAWSCSMRLEHTSALLLLCCTTAGSLQLRVSPSKTPVRSDRDAERTGRGGGGGGGSSSAGGNGQAHKGAQLPDMLLSNREEAGAAGAGANSSNAPGYEASGGAAAAAAAPAVNGVAEVEPPAPEAQSLSPTSAPAVGGGLAEASGVGALAGVVAGAPGMVEGTGVQVQGVAPNPPAVHVGAPESPEGLLVATSPA
jgi:hypothetical protein